MKTEMSSRPAQEVAANTGAPSLVDIRDNLDKRIAELEAEIRITNQKRRIVNELISDGF